MPPLYPHKIPRETKQPNHGESKKRHDIEEEVMHELVCNEANTEVHQGIIARTIDAKTKRKTTIVEEEKSWSYAVSRRHSKHREVDSPFFNVKSINKVVNARFARFSSKGNSPTEPEHNWRRFITKTKEEEKEEPEGRWCRNQNDPRSQCYYNWKDEDALDRALICHKDGEGLDELSYSEKIGRLCSHYSPSQLTILYTVTAVELGSAWKSLTLKKLTTRLLVTKALIDLLVEHANMDMEPPFIDLSKDWTSEDTKVAK